MTDERRYQEEEIRQIFELATSREDLGTPVLSEPEAGLTLAELQGIGREVGLAPERVAEAAAALDTRPEALPRRTFWGMPISVGRMVELPRAPTDREWELLVAELRQTFGARGKVTGHGGLREWTNGNLHACVEPTESGYRLRLGTLKGNALGVSAMGVAGLVIGVVSFLKFLSSGDFPDDIFIPLLFGAGGAGALIANWLRLPRWAGRRERQMKYIADRASALIEPTR